MFFRKKKKMRKRKKKERVRRRNLPKERQDKSCKWKVQELIVLNFLLSEMYAKHIKRLRQNPLRQIFSDTTTRGKKGVKKI